MSAHCHDHGCNTATAQSPRYRRILWIALIVNGNLAVTLAALGVFGTGTGIGGAWPDLAVAAAMAALAISGGYSVFKQARQELRWDQHA